MNLEVHTVTSYNIFTIIMYSAMQYNDHVYQSGSKSFYKKRKRGLASKFRMRTMQNQLLKIVNINERWIYSQNTGHY